MNVVLPISEMDDLVRLFLQKFCRDDLKIRQDGQREHLESTEIALQQTKTGLPAKQSPCNLQSVACVYSVIPTCVRAYA